MKEILNLIKLDFITVKRKSLPLMCILTVAITVFSVFTMPHMAVVLIIFSGLLAQPVFVIAEKCGYNKLYGILPVKRRSIVFGRFALGVLMMLFCTLICIIGGLLAYKFNVAENFGSDMEQFIYLSRDWTKYGFTIPLAGAFIFLGGSVFAAVEYTVLFIFGAEKELPAILGVGFVLVGIFVAIEKLLKVDLSAVGDFLGDMVYDHIVLLYICLYAGGIALMALGALISSYFFCKKEL